MLKCTATRAHTMKRLGTRSPGSVNFEESTKLPLQGVFSCFGKNETTVLNSDPATKGEEKKTIYGQI